MLSSRIAGAEAGATEAPAPAPAVPVVLATRGDTLDTSALRALLSEELNRPVVLEGESTALHPPGMITITYRRAASELTVTWDDGEHTLTRVVAAPSEPAQVLNESTLLAGNLARQQIDELLPPVERVEPAKPVEPVAPVVPPAPPVAPPAPAEVRPFTLGVFYPLATHHGHAEVTSNFDLNLLYGRVGSIDGAQLGGVNVVARDQGPPASMAGLQIGYLGNLVHGSVQGVQASTLFNRSGDLTGVQLSLVNSAGDVDGLQVGLINLARNVRGASIGLINIADDIQGLPLAPFSVTKTGGVHPVLWSGSSGFGNAGVKFATHHTYTLFFGSYHRAFDLELVGGGFALGGSVDLGAGFRADIDALGTYLVAPELTRSQVFNPDRIREYHQQLVQPRLRLMVAYRQAAHLGAFLGVAALGQLRSQFGWDQITASVGPEIFGGLEL